MDMIKFLELIGWGRWAEEYLAEDADLATITFADFCFDTMPAMMFLFFIILLLNWIMGIISDVCRLRFGGSKII